VALTCAFVDRRGRSGRAEGGPATVPWKRLHGVFAGNTWGRFVTPMWSSGSLAIAVARQSRSDSGPCSRLVDLWALAGCGGAV